VKKFLAILFAVPAFAAETTTNSVSIGSQGGANAVYSLFRVLGALAIVLSLFLGAIYLLKNWQRFAVRHGARPQKLRILEVKSLGPRQAIYVIGYEGQRLLISSSPSGVSMLSALPEELDEPSEVSASPGLPLNNFAEALMRSLSRKS
jgi:flagellar biogenesis protein FliO